MNYKTKRLLPCCLGLSVQSISQLRDQYRLGRYVVEMLSPSQLAVLGRELVKIMTDFREKLNIEKRKHQTKISIREAPRWRFC